MTKKWLIPAICALVAVVVVAIVVFTPTEEDRVKQAVTRFAKVVEPRPNENPAFALGRINDTFKEVLDDRVEIAVPELPEIPADRKSLAQLAMQGGARYGEVSIEVSDVRVKIDEGKTRAQVDCVAELREKGGQGRRDRRRVSFGLRNGDRWRITSIHVATSGGE
jgi:hypothetical protein